MKTETCGKAGPCAKRQVRCELHLERGGMVVGENLCMNPQPVCPREPGEDYTKCQTVCQQIGHAEAVALQIAGASASGADAVLIGHSHACRDCQERLFGAGVRSLRVVQPWPEK